MEERNSSNNNNNDNTLGIAVSFTLLLSQIGTIINPILQIRKPGLRDVGKFEMEGGRQNIPNLENSSC